MVLDLLRKKKPSKEDEQERRRTADILDLAMGQRSKVHIQFDEKDTNLTGVTATVMGVNDAAVLLELGGVAGLKDRFLGKSLTCFFRVVEREDRHREIFYNFTSQILRIRQQPDRPPQVAVSFPAALNGAQRRKSLRMKPDFSQFSHIALWKYDASGFDIAKPTVGTVHFKNGLASIDNISGGGLRFRLRRAHLKETGLEPKKGDRFILFFTFHEQVPKLRNEYWLVAKVNNIQPEPVSGDLALGLEYVANGVRQPESGKVDWSKIQDNVIDDMAQRIYLWHVALYRDRGLS
ncbi:PilZ domain-containing protein [Solidesulfovibrio sp.]